MLTLSKTEPHMLTKQKLRTWISLLFSCMPNIRGKKRLASALSRLLLPHSESDCVVETEMQLGYRMLLDLRSITEAIAAYTRDYDTDDIGSCLRLLHADAVVLDVGANIGFWTVPMALGLSAEGRVLAFEPLPGNAGRLRDNVRLNGVERAVRIYEIGLSDRAATVEISLREDFAHGSETGNAAIVIDDSDQQFHCTTIRVDALDRVFDSLDIHRLDFVKLDIEGHEDKFLAGACQVLSRFRPIMFVEVNAPYYERRGLRVDEVLQSWLDSYRYVCALRIRRGWNISELQRRKPPIDNVLFLPEERVSELLPILS